MIDLITLLVHIIACAVMTGIIWEVQQVHYPMFHALESLAPETFKRWMHYHTSHITPIVGPVMIIEALSGIVLLYRHPHWLPESWIVIDMVMLGGIFLATVLFSIPRHQALSTTGYERHTVARLVTMNWIRTSLWTIRLVLWMSFVVFLMSVITTAVPNP